MIIHNCFHDKDLYIPLKIQNVTCDGISEEEESILVSEHVLEIDYGGDEMIHTRCTPDHLPELVVGKLITEGIVSDEVEIDEIRINESGSLAEVILSHQDKPSCPVDPVLSHLFNRNDVFQMIRFFSNGMKIHKKTSGTHSCILFGHREDERICFEDIGRYNAADKCIGAAILRNIRLSDLALFTSGRVSQVMIMKAIHAGIPLIISKSVPTDQAVLKAREYGLTLITSAWPDSFRIAAGIIH